MARQNTPRMALERYITCNRDLVHTATKALIIVHSQMLHAAIVPQRHGAFLPNLAIGKLMSSGMSKQAFE